MSVRYGYRESGIQVGVVGAADGPPVHNIMFRVNHESFPVCIDELKKLGDAPTCQDSGPPGVRIESDDDDLTEGATPGVAQVAMTGSKVDGSRRGGCAAFGAPGGHVARRPGGHEVTIGSVDNSSFKQQVDHRFGHLQSRVESSMLSSQAASSPDAKLRFDKIENVA